MEEALKVTTGPNEETSIIARKGILLVQRKEDLDSVDAILVQVIPLDYIIGGSNSSDQDRKFGSGGNNEINWGSRRFSSNR